MTTIRRNAALRLPCVQGHFLPHLETYASQLGPHNIISLLGHNPCDWPKLRREKPAIYEMYSGLQRDPDSDKRGTFADSIHDYLVDRVGPDATEIVGGFSAVSIAVRNPTRFHLYKDSENEMVQAGWIELDTSEENFRIGVDGLGRMKAALQSEAALQQAFLLPVVLFFPTPEKGELTLEDCAQLFSDLNSRVFPVPANLRIVGDQSDIYIRLTNRLAEKPVIDLNGGMAKRKPSLSKSDNELVVQTLLHRFVRGAMEGIRFQESDRERVENPHLTKANFGQKLLDLEEYLETLSIAMGSSFKDHRLLHLSSSGWQALGATFFSIYVERAFTHEQRIAFTKAIAGIDWSRENPEWVSSGLMRTSIMKGKEVQKFASAGGRTGRADLHRFILTKIGLIQTASLEVA